MLPEISTSFLLLLFLLLQVDQHAASSTPPPSTSTNTSAVLRHGETHPYHRHPDEICLNLTSSPPLHPFVDPLPTMPVISLVERPRITIGAYKIQQKLHRDLPPTTLYAFGTSQYSAVYPGPTLQAKVGHAAWVRWENHIPDEEPMLPLDRSMDWANPRLGGVPHVVHNHGQEDPGWSDGHPDAWSTPLGEHGETYVTQEYYYPNQQYPATLWYHDHTFGITRLMIGAGLVGAYLIDDEALTPRWVPRVYHTLVIQDKAFFDDGEIKYPSVGINPAVHPRWCPDYFGDVVLVNGKVWPYLEVSPGIHRFRLINAANSKFFILTLSDPRVSFIKIASDAQFLYTPIIQQELRIAPAERWEFLIDFSHLPIGHTVVVSDIGPAPFPAGPPANQSVLQFRVSLHAPTPSSTLHNMPTPLTPNQLQTIPPALTARYTAGVTVTDWDRIYKRPFVFNAQLDSGSNLVALFLQDHLHFHDPTTEILHIYSHEGWAFINPLPTGHPIHLHLVNFVILLRQPFNASAFLNRTCSFGYPHTDRRSCYTGGVEGPDVDQVGWKDTGVVLPGYVTWFYVTTSPGLVSSYGFDPTDFPGYLWHCHLLEHEDNEMMRPMLISKTGFSTRNVSFPAPGLHF